MAVNYTDSDKAKYMTGQYLKEIKLHFPEINLTVLNNEIYSNLYIGTLQQKLKNILNGNEQTFYITKKTYIIIPVLLS